MAETPFPTDDERARGDFDIGYVCLFCGKEIIERRLDPCEVELRVPNGAVGWFTCHADCIRAASHPDSHFPDLEARAEWPPGVEPPSEEETNAVKALDDLLGRIAEAVDDLDSPLGADAIDALTDELRSVAERYGAVAEDGEAADD